jgi:hypothetical protein
MGPGNSLPPALQQLPSNVAEGATPARIAALQNLADRNRAVLFTSLHKDLLLRDWLIQWSRLINQ